MTNDQLAPIINDILKLHPEDGDVLVLRMPLTSASARDLDDFQTMLHRHLPEGQRVLLVILHQDQSLTLLDVDQMRELGWARAGAVSEAIAPAGRQEA